MKSRPMRWSEDVACTRVKERKVTKNFGQKSHLGDLSIDGKKS
jgi:hypothetical protein